MKFWTILFLVFINSQLFSQQQIPDLVIPITVTFDIPPYPPPYVGEFLEIGLDSTATDGLDEHLGEFDLPPVPPPGWPAYFEIPPNYTIYGVHKDFRFGEFPYTGERIHRLRLLSTNGATIHWVLPTGITGLLKDAITGEIVNVPMSDSGSYYIPYSFISSLVIHIYYDNQEPPTPEILSEVLISSGPSSFQKHLKFGLDSTATDGIDWHLGEVGPLPPFPPPGAFEAQLFLPENNFSGSLSSYSDFRFASIPFTGTKEWRLAYQAEFGNDIIITWDFPSYMTGVLLDIINGTFINVPMIDSGSYTLQNPDVFNRLRMIIDFDIELPVELVSFNATLLDNNIKLDWTTATETNNSGFTIERISIPNSKSEFRNSNWTEIGFVPGFGTTTEPKSYSFINENVNTGNYKYRLKQIDFDGTFTLSNEIEVEVDFSPKEFVLYQNYPNPFNPKTVISYQLPVSGNVTIKIYDILGNEVATLVNEEKQPGVYEVEFNTSLSHSGEVRNLSSGIYFYQLNAGSYTNTKKMILAK